MIIVTSFFTREPQYYRLLKIFYNTAREKMPSAKIDVVQFIPATYGYCNNDEINHHWDTYYAFMTKISHAIEINDNILMSDSDIMFMKSVSGIWAKDFDIAITTRDHKCKYNTGICFIKPTRQAKIFLKLWKQHTKEIAKRFDLKEINQWMGIDQAALYKTLHEKLSIKILELPCRIWNAEQKSYKKINNDTKVFHVKCGFRDIFFNKRPMTQRYEFLKPILERMKYYENIKCDIPFYRPTA
jgi:hypothetical protein